MGTRAEQGVFCEVCEHSLSLSDNHKVPKSIGKGREIFAVDPADEGYLSYDYAFPNPMEIPYFTVEQLEEHMKKVHAEPDAES
jgi:hypothetical protein